MVQRHIGPVTFELATGLGEGARKNSKSGNIQYKQGPVWVGLAFDGLDSNTNLAIVAGGYDFGVVRPTASYSRAKGGLNGDATSFTVSALVAGGAQIATDLVGGQVDSAVLVLSTAMPFLNQGKIKALSVSDTARVPQLPNVKRIGEED